MAKSVILPKVNDVVNSISFDDAGIFPDYFIDRTYDSNAYNDNHCPIVRLQEPQYNAEKYKHLLEIRKEAEKIYNDWIASAPWFVNVIIK